MSFLPCLFAFWDSIPTSAFIFCDFTHVRTCLPTGTFAVVQLMIANAIERVLTAHSLDVCFTGEFNGTMLDGDQINELLVPNGTATCGELKVDIAVTLAFTSGAIMVSCTKTAYVFSVVCLYVCLCVHIHIPCSDTQGANLGTSFSGCMGFKLNLIHTKWRHVTSVSELQCM